MRSFVLVRICKQIYVHVYVQGGRERRVRNSIILFSPFAEVLMLLEAHTQTFRGKKSLGEKGKRDREGLRKGERGKERGKNLFGESDEGFFRSGIVPFQSFHGSVPHGYQVCNRE